MLHTKKNIQAVAVVVLSMVISTTSAHAAPKISNGLTFEWVGKGGTLDSRYNHMSYIPIEIKASTDYYVQDIEIKPSGSTSPYISLCEKDHCGYTPLGEPPTFKVQACDISSGHTTNLSPGGSCFIWVMAKNQDGKLPVYNPDKAFNLSINTSQCNKADDPSCRSPDQVNYQVNLTMDVNNTLYAGGEKGLYAFDNNWSQLGKPGEIDALAWYEGDLYFGGNFQQIRHDTSTANHNIGVWNGVEFHDVNLGSVLSVTDKVNVLQSKEGNLLIGGIMPSLTNLVNWNGTATKQYINSSVNALDNTILVTAHSADYSFGNVIYNGSGWLSPNLEVTYMPKEVNENTAVVDLGQNVYCIGGTSSLVSLSSRTGLECYTQSGSYLVYWANHTFSGPQVCRERFSVSSKAGINTLDLNPSQDMVVAGGCMYKLLAGGSSKPIYNIAYAPKNKVVYSAGTDAWQPVSSSGLDNDIYALLHTGNYEFVGGAFDAVCKSPGCTPGQNTGPITYFLFDENHNTTWLGDRSFKWSNLKDSYPEEPAIHSLVLAPMISNTSLNVNNR